MTDLSPLVVWLADNHRALIAGSLLGLGFFAVTEGWVRWVGRQEEERTNGS